jgi:hypothetical protein
MGVFMADPPSAVAAFASPRALARESFPNTTACRRRAHGRGRWTTGQSSFGILTGLLPLHEGVCRETVAPIKGTRQIHVILYAKGELR